MRFLHIADIHLGYQQYNSRARFNDFGRAFLHVVDEARAHQVDFVLLAGDFFEKRSVDPLAMRQAVAGLQRLHDAHIPVIAVEGNHERAHYRDQYSWLEFLDAIGLITLLDPRIEDGHLHLEPYAPETGGAFVDLPGGVRVYGIKYYGASTDRVLGLFGQAVAELAGPPPAYSILLLHAGLEGILPRCSGALSRQAVAPLRSQINYLALGHIHKPYEVDGWIYNPGSLETWAMDEVAWTDRGYYIVDLKSHSPMTHQARLVATPRRHFVRLRLEVDRYLTPEALYQGIRARLPAPSTAPAGAEPVVELTLTGSLAFDRLDLDLGRIESLIAEAYRPLLTRVQNATVPAQGSVTAGSWMTRAELEHDVLRELIERDSRYRPAAAEWAAVALELKRKALAGESPAVILDYLRGAWSQIATEDQ